MLVGSQVIGNRNSLVLVAAAAVLALVLGFSYGATFNGDASKSKMLRLGVLNGGFLDIRHSLQCLVQSLWHG
jgi:hypothetical protein